MKKLYHLLFILLAVFTVNSQIIFDENFNYPAGDSLTAHGWIRHSGSQGQILVTTPGLTFTGYPLSGIGNSARLDTVGGSGIDVNKQITPDSTSSEYAAFMLNVQYATSTGEYFFHIGNTNIGIIFRARVFAKSNGSSLILGLSKGRNTGTYTTESYLFNTTYLVIIKYTFNSGSSTDDAVSMFIFNSGIPSTEPFTPTIGPLTDATITDLTSFGTIALRQGVSANRPILLIDGIRVFKSWANIIGIRPISTIAKSFSLSQNYPNPFNPVTYIRFSIPERGYISLIVYDIMGREAAGLVEGKYSQGTYEIDFNAEGLGSGIYMYRINYVSETGIEFTETKKLLLVK